MGQKPEVRHTYGFELGMRIEMIAWHKDLSSGEPFRRLGVAAVSHWGSLLMPMVLTFGWLHCTTQGRIQATDG